MSGVILRYGNSSLRITVLMFAGQSGEGYRRLLRSISSFSSVGNLLQPLANPGVAGPAGETVSLLSDRIQIGVYACICIELGADITNGWDEYTAKLACLGISMGQWTSITSSNSSSCPEARVCALVEVVSGVVADMALAVCAPRSQGILRRYGRFEMSLKGAISLENKGCG